MKNTLTIAKALADGGRMRIVAALFRHEELCVCQIVEMLHLSSPTISRHMSILQYARLVQSRKDGKWVFYCLAEPFPETLHDWLSRSLSKSPVIADDRALLETILSYDPEDLCRRQKERKERLDQNQAIQTLRKI